MVQEPERPDRIPDPEEIGYVEAPEKVKEKLREESGRENSKSVYFSSPEVLNSLSQNSGTGGRMAKDIEDGAEIVKTEDTLGGKPRIEGTRIRVIDVVQSYEMLDYSIEKIAYEYDISPTQVLEALKYYYEHPSEIRDQIREEKRTVKRMEEEGTVKTLKDLI